MTRWVDPKPTQISGEWLRADGEEWVSRAMQLEGDAIHLGWSLQLNTDDGAVPVPVADALSQAVRLAIIAAVDSFEGEHDGQLYAFNIDEPE